nr:uncharacterized protein LOC107971917 isoform X4 [Pan troglodytes]XP_054511586.1 uncharacterized protein LOC107971917 isoform X4 [Pan troglodytes]
MVGVDGEQDSGSAHCIPATRSHRGTHTLSRTGAAILPPPSCRRHLAAAILPPPSCRRHLAAAILPPPSASTSAAAARRDPTQPPRPPPPPPHPIGSVACSGPRPHRRAAQPPRKDFHGLRIWVRLAVSSGSGSQEDTIKLSARAAALSRLQNPLSNSLPLLRAGLRSSLALGWRHHFLSTSTSWEGTGREECGLLEI